MAPSTQALALGAPVAGKPRVGSRMWYNLPCLGCDKWGEPCQGQWDKGGGTIRFVGVRGG